MSDQWGSWPREWPKRTTHCGWCGGKGYIWTGPPLNHAPDTVVGVGYPKCKECKGTGRVKL